LGGGQHGDGGTDEALGVAGDDGVDSGEDGTGDLQVVLEVGARPGRGGSQLAYCDREDIKLVEARSDGMPSPWAIGERRAT
jgi:hypothetical protein